MFPLPSSFTSIPLHVTRSFALVVAGLFVAAGQPVEAQTSDAEVDEAVDALFAWATDDAPGCAVTVSNGGEIVVDRAYGAADLDRGVAITPDTRFDTGSVQKQFVAAAVLLLAEDRRLGLGDDVREHVPEFPDLGHVVTLDHLLTHTSGVRDWVALQQLSERGGDALSLIVRQRGLNFEPGTEWSYSNSGYVLLKEVVARVAGVPFSRFVHERLFEPLGMPRTVYADDVREVEDRALAYERDGDGWRLDVLEGDARGDGGALFSTARDLVTWSEALGDGRLGAFVSEAIQEPTRLGNGRELSYARGLFLEDDPSGLIVWHTGSAGGYKSSVSRLVDHDLSLALLCNGGESMDRGRIANGIVDLFVPPAEAPPPVAEAEGVDVGGREGLYVGERDGELLRLVARGGRLMILGGGPLVALADGRFRVAEPRLTVRSGDAFEVRFVQDDAFDLVSMEGDAERFRRAETLAPGGTELAAFAGRYESDELGATIEVETGEGSLRARLNGGRPFDFEPAVDDVFQLGPMTLQFRRDGGRVVGLAFSNPAVREIAFARTGEAAVEAEPETAPVEGPVSLEALVGFYEAARPGNGVAVTVEGGALYAEPTGQSRMPLVHRSGTTFFVGEAGAPMTVTFTLADGGGATAMELRRGDGPGRTFPKRVD